MDFEPIEVYLRSSSIADDVDDEYSINSTSSLILDGKY